MNPRKHLIIIKGEIKTSEVKSGNYDFSAHMWNVEFNNGKIYSYGNFNVEWIREPEIWSPDMYRISRDGRIFSNIDIIYVFKGRSGTYLHICYANGMERDYLHSDLQLVKSCLTEGKEKNVFEYLKEIAGLSNLRNEKTGEKILSKHLKEITAIGSDVALAKYLNPSKLQRNNTQREYIPIFPFGCNNSQYKAVKNAMEHQISVIQGPPGTGKTQTILNIIANILMEGKTLQVVSNSNSATENVYEKLASSKYDLGFIAAELGKSDNKKKFVQQQSAGYPDFSTWKCEKEPYILRNEIREKSKELKVVFDKQEELASLKQEQAQLLTELEYFNQYIQESDVHTDRIKIKKKLLANHWMELWQECQLLVEEKQRIGLWFRIKGCLKYGIWNRDFYKQDLANIITTFQWMYYEAKKDELAEKIAEIERYLQNAEGGLLNNLCHQSMALLKDRLARKYGSKGKRRVFEEKDLWKNPYEVLEEYPVILSTTFSSRNSLNTDVIYDYLIMDEASQIDVTTGALAMSCARNVVIVGDTKQLPNVVTKEDEAQAKAIFDKYNIDAGYQYTKSFLQSVLEVMPDVSQTMLREHYRCHPKIINFCNQKFYRGELIVMTEDQGEEDVLAVMRTAPGNHVRDHYSQRQIDVIRNEIIPKYVTNPSETGIIAPYNNQVKALEKEFTDIDAATVHKFQGREKDTIIISTVDDEITDFADDPYLINVAVSRAKKNLLLVVTGNEQVQERNITDLEEYIRYQNFEVTDSKIYSVFDYLYKQYTEARKEYLQKRKRISEFDSENLMFALIEDVISADKYASLDVVCHLPMNMLIKNPERLNEEQCRYAMHPSTHVDFLLYNRISKKPVLAVEVDGYEYHKEGTVQASRDVLKNRILELYGIPLVRFKTNGSGEKERIEEVLDKGIL